MKTIRLAVIGLGNIGHIYTRMTSAMQSEGIVPVAACDIFEKARARFSNQFPNLPVYASVDELLARAEFEAALVLTSDPCHAAPFIQCLDAGKHVYVEKPVGNNIPEIMEMVQAINRNPQLVAASGHVLRYYPVNRKIKQMAEAGEFGEIFYMEGDYIHNLKGQGKPERINEALGRNWYLEDEKPMVGGGCHPFDVLRWIVDSPVVAVASMGNKIAFPAMRHEDCIVSIYQFANGAVAKVTALYAAVAPYAPFNNIAVYGTKCSVWRGQVCYDEKNWLSLQYEVYKEQYGHGFEREILDFANAIRTGDPVCAPAKDCAQSEIATLVATDALHHGQKLEIPQIS
jgi:predicted dehydrogenase